MNIVVAVPVDENLASFIGKRGSANSIIFYNRKLGSDVVVALFPSQEEEKVYALAESLLLASQIVLSTADVDKKFGEALVAGSLLQKKILLTDDNNVGNILQSAGITNCTVVGRDRILDVLHENALSEAGTEKARVDIDKAFPVRGIGTVVLGIVTRGTVRQHDKLYHTSGKEVMVRSMQSQDEDITVAPRGTRVGLSLKDIGDDEVSKGDLLTPGLVKPSTRIEMEYRVSKAVKEKIGESGIYGLATNFSYSECVVKKVENNKLELALRAKLPVEIGDEVFLIRKEMPRIFAAGRVTQTFES